MSNQKPMLKILVIGETCADKFVYCKTNRLSPEAPVPVIIPIKSTENPGMAGNTERNLGSIGKEFLNNTNLQILSFYGDLGTEKVRYIDEESNHMFLRVDSNNEKYDPLFLNNFHLKCIKEQDIVIISDYNKGFLNETTLEQIAENSKFSIIDTKRKLSKEIADLFTFIKLNEEEYNKNFHLDPKNIIITKGKNGAEWKEINFPANNPQDTIDVSGAGDTFTAAFAIGWWIYKNAPDAIKFANQMASLVVSKKGVVTPF